MNEISQHIQSFFGVANDDLAQIAELFKPKELVKNDYLVKQGSYNATLSFLQSGYIRVFNIEEKSGKEITQWVSTPGSFVADIAGLFFESAAKWDIQAITDCQLYTISQDDYKCLNEYVKDWAKIEKLFMAKCFSTLEDRVYGHLAMDSEDRYKQFFQYDPAMFNHVPLHYIASMLGMTPETLSRIRKKLTS